MPSSGVEPLNGGMMRRMSPPQIWRAPSRNTSASPNVRMSP
jgi:hypothetical protein